jgi:NhaP-type Na+/H+ or K+/H+ antiporter
VATLLLVAASCDALSDDTGLVAAITMGIALANIPGLDLLEDRPFFQTIVQLTIGLLFISISATVVPGSLPPILLGTLGLIACLVLGVRPVVALVATTGTDLAWSERAFIAGMDPRGIVAASTAATFSAPLAAAGVPGAAELLPITFLVIVGTVSVYGFAAAPLARLLGLGEVEEAPSLAGADPLDDA